MKNMHVWPYFVSEGIAWFSDICVGGLYTYDFEKEKICCRIRPDVLFSNGIFKIEAIACWKSFVFVFSKMMNGNHIVYNSLNGEIRIFNGLERENHNVIHQAIVIGDILYLIPSDIEGYIISINLCIYKEIGESIWFASKRVGEGIIMRTWLPKSYGKSLYIPEYNGKQIFCITNDNVKVVDMDIPSGLFTVGVFKEELWAAPLHDKYIVCLTMDGKEKERVDISCDYENDKKSIWEIIPKENFVFILHWKRPEIDIYDRKNKKIIQISGAEFKRACEGDPSDRQYYLPYIINGNVIRFFAFKM